MEQKRRAAAAQTAFGGWLLVFRKGKLSRKHEWAQTPRAFTTCCGGNVDECRGAINAIVLGHQINKSLDFVRHTKSGVSTTLKN